MGRNQAIQISRLAKFVLKGTPALLQDLEHHVITQIEHKMGHLVAVQIGMVKRLDRA